LGGNQSMFNQYFEVFLADNPEGREINYRVRYQVYCLETGYENPNNYPEKIEKDDVDSRSAHFIVRARATGTWIAAMRLVIGCLDQLPISQLANIDPDLLLKNTRANSLDNFKLCAEVSRLCVISQYRRRAHERNVPHQIPWNPNNDRDEVANQERRKAPWLMLALLHSARIYSEEEKIPFWFFLAASSLARIIKGLGMKLDQTGPACDHRGIRYPFVANMPENFDQLELKYPDLAETLRGEPHYRLFSELARDEYEFPLAV
jgi:N-acyl amino acid synthase of PEP-CTERM/exosortase system